MAVIPFGEYLPDLPDLQNPGATVAKNVMPLTSKSYSPFSALVTFTGSLDARCQGAIGAKDYDGVSYLFAGDSTKLYLWDWPTTVNWADVSDVAGYTVGVDAFWRFVQYGNRVVACVTGNNLQTFLLGTDSVFSDLSAYAPQASAIAVIRDFVMLGNTYDAVDDSVPNQIWWCAIDDPTSWPTPGTAAAVAVQSDKQILPEGGAIQSIIGAVGGSDGAVFLEEAIYRLLYVGSPLIFQIDKVEKQKGTRVPGSVINVGTMAFYLGVDGFYAFDGTNSIPIGNQKIDKTFYKDFNQSYYYMVNATADTINKQVLWAYPGADSEGGLPNRIIIYNWGSNRWSLVDYGVECFFRSYSTGYTLEQLDDFGTMDTLPYSLDSRFWSGGTLLLSGFDSNHALGNFGGDSLEATLETGEFDGGNGQRLFISGIRPLVDGGVSSTSVGVRELPTTSLTYSTPSLIGVDGVCPQRVSGRYARAKVSVAAGGSWTHAIGVEPVVQQDGDR